MLAPYRSTGTYAYPTGDTFLYVANVTVGYDVENDDDYGIIDLARQDAKGVMREAYGSAFCGLAVTGYRQGDECDGFAWVDLTLSILLSSEFDHLPTWASVTDAVYDAVQLAFSGRHGMVNINQPPESF